MLEASIEFNSLTFNAQANSDLSTSPHHWIKVDTVDGLQDDDIRYESHPIPGGIGERSGDVLISGKQLVLSGRIWGWNLTYLRIGERALKQAFWDRAQHKLKYYDWADGQNAIQLYFTVRKNQPLVITDEITQFDHYMSKWTVGLRADDPRSYKVSGDTVYPTWQT